MSNENDVYKEIERGRYKLAEQIKRFEELKLNYEKATALAEHDEKIAEHIQRFETVHGASFISDIAAMTGMIQKAEQQYQTLVKMSDTHLKRLAPAEDKQEQLTNTVTKKVRSHTKYI